MRRQVLCFFVLVGCGSEDSGSGGPDAAAAVDAADQLQRCLVPATLGAIGAVAGAADSPTLAAGPALTFTGNLNSEPNRDVLFVKLQDGRGPFASSPPAVGTYSISGADTDLDTCGVCVNLIADLVAMAGPSKIYIATSGTVEITSVAGNLTGSLSNLVFEDTAAVGPMTDCTSALTSASFDAPLP